MNTKYINTSKLYYFYGTMDYNRLFKSIYHVMEHMHLFVFMIAYRNFAHCNMNTIAFSNNYYTQHETNLNVSIKEQN